jgi:hypothetical protein
MHRVILSLVISCAAGGALAQNAAPAPAMPTEFPVDAAALSTDELVKQFTGKTIAFAAHNGMKVRLQLKGNGYFFYDDSNGGRASGKWVMREAGLCSVVNGDPREICSGIRKQQDKWLLKRSSNGEVVELKVSE